MTGIGLQQIAAVWLLGVGLLLGLFYTGYRRSPETVLCIVHAEGLHVSPRMLVAIFVVTAVLWPVVIPVALFTGRKNP